MSLRIRFPIRTPDPFVADDDRALVNRFAESHDESAFTGLVNRHARMVLGVCRRVVGDAHIAEDAFQAVFLVLAQNPQQAVAASSVGGWLFGIARRVGLAARRQELRRQKHLIQTSVNRTQVHGPDFDNLLRVLDEELGALPEIYKAALISCLLEERTQDDAAKQLGWSLSTLRRRLDRGKELLHARLVRRGVTLAAGLFAGALAPSVRAGVPPKLLATISPVGQPSVLAQALASEVVRGVLKGKLVVCATLVAVVFGGLAIGLERTDTSLGSTTLVGMAQLKQPTKGVEVTPSPYSREQEKWVTISGRVVFPEKQELPVRRQVPADSIKDRDFFRPSGELLFYEDVVIDPKTRGIANAVVWLRPDSNDRRAKFPSEKIHPTVTQQTDRVINADRNGFQPRVMAARIGDRLAFNNTTPIPFNVNYQRISSTENGIEMGDFNIVLPSTKTHYTKPLPLLLSPDQYMDNIHPWIKGYVWAFDHPYFAITDEHGNFSIKDAPEGSWRLVVWHEKTGYKGGPQGRLGQRITITNGEKGTQNLEPIVLDSNRWNNP